MGISKKEFMEQRQIDLDESQGQFIDHALIGTPSGDISKAIIAKESARIINAVLEGEADPLKYIAYMNALERLLKEIKTGIMETAIEEFDKYGERQITVLGSIELAKAEAGVRLDYSNTPAWVEIKERESEIAKERKELESTLKTLKKSGAMSIDDELVDVNPPIRTSTTVVKVTVK